MPFPSAIVPPIQPVGLTAGAAVLRAARMLLPVREAGQNLGRFVETIIRYAGGTPPEPWCASFEYYVGHQMLGSRWPCPKTRSCDVILEWARAKELLREQPTPHAIFLILRSETDAFHTGFVEGIAPEQGPNAFRTVEGNGNDDGSANGDGVYSLIRGEEKDAKTGRPDTSRYVFVPWELAA
jgi:hypothetical protein